MKRIWFALLSLFPAMTALAHPGHGKPGFLHTHSPAELADWAVLGVVALAVALIAWRVLRK